MVPAQYSTTATSNTEVQYNTTAATANTEVKYNTTAATADTEVQYSSIAATAPSNSDYYAEQLACHKPSYANAGHARPAQTTSSTEDKMLPVPEEFSTTAPSNTEIQYDMHNTTAATAHTEVQYNSIAASSDTEGYYGTTATANTNYYADQHVYAKPNYCSDHL